MRGATSLHVAGVSNNWYIVHTYVAGLRVLRVSPMFAFEIHPPFAELSPFAKLQI